MGGTLRAGLSDKATFVLNYPLKGTIIQLKNLVFTKKKLCNWISNDKKRKNDTESYSVSLL